MLNGDTLVQRLIAARCARPDEIIPCSEEDLHEVARRAPGPLPTAYLDFLYVVGRGAGRFLIDQDIYYPKMLDLNNYAKVILADVEGGALVLPADAFVFSIRYMEQFLFFHANGQSGNPPVFHYIDSQPCFRPIGTFWEFVESELAISEELARAAPELLEALKRHPIRDP